MKFSVFQVSRRGGREKNEDRMGYSYTRGSGMFLLADGMGGHPDGEVAAHLALQSLSATYQKVAEQQIENVSEFLTDAVMAAHRQILRYALERGMTDTPRTTIVAAFVQNGLATWVHCGDSRLYLVRGGELMGRTRDHSYQERRPGSSTAALTANQANRNILFTCLGSPTKPILDVTGPVPLQQGDKILLCSDGLWGSLSDSDIVLQLGSKPVAQAVPDLVEAALDVAGDKSDNVTVIAMEWETPNEFEATIRASISTDDIDDGVFASTLHADLLGGEPEAYGELDEADIERSIAEINDAIRRTVTRKR
jgi:PPM family protein phosphatase